MRTCIRATWSYREKVDEGTAWEFVYKGDKRHSIPHLRILEKSGCYGDRGGDRTVARQYSLTSSHCKHTHKSQNCQVSTGNTSCVLLVYKKPHLHGSGPQKSEAMSRTRKR